MLTRLEYFLLFLGCIVLLCVTFLAALWWLIWRPGRLLLIEDMIDQTTCAAVSGNKDMSISRWTANARKQGKWYGWVLCWMYGRVAPHHCTNVENGNGG